MSADKIEENLSLFLETSCSAVVLVDQQLEILDANAKFNDFFEDAPSTVANLFVPKDEKQLQATFDSPDRGLTFTNVLIGNDGLRRWIEWNVKSDGMKCFLIGTDVSRYHRSLEELNKQRSLLETKKKSEDLFVAKMNHELRTPLNAIIGYCQVLLRTELMDPQIDHAQRIRHNGKKLLKQIDNLLSISESKLDLKVETIELSPLLQSIVDEFEFNLEENELIVCIEGNAEEHTIEADFSSLRHVVRNLLDNAIKFSNKGKIRLLIESEGDMTRALHIVDEGVGVCDENADSIFSPFQKGALLANDCGVGLGLSVAKKLCMQMGFELNLCPAKQGSKFTINFVKVDE